MVDHHLCGVVPRLERCSVDGVRWRWKSRESAQGDWRLLYFWWVCLFSWRTPKGPTILPGTASTWIGKPSPPLRNHWQFHMAYHAGQRMRAQVIMMVFQMLGESLANHWLFRAFDSLALRHHRCVVPFRASHLQVGRCFHWSTQVPALGQRPVGFC